MSIVTVLQDLLSVTETNENVKRINLTLHVPDILRKLHSPQLPEALQTLGSTLAECEAAIDSESTYQRKFHHHDLKTSQWASRRQRLFYRHRELTTFCTELFEAMKQAASEFESSDLLARNNLFHGHIFYNPELDDVLIIFHAFEYPEDIFENCAVKALEIEPATPTFKSTHEAFRWRNAIYSAKQNAVFIINAQTWGSGHKALFPFSDFTLDESLCGVHICDVNYFPQEGVAPFIA